jgi:hypothetical protein
LDSGPFRYGPQWYSVVWFPYEGHVFFLIVSLITRLAAWIRSSCDACESHLFQAETSAVSRNRTLDPLRALPPTENQKHPGLSLYRERWSNACVIVEEFMGLRLDDVGFFHSRMMASILCLYFMAEEEGGLTQWMAAV